MDERTHERIPGDEWTASALAFREPDLYAAVLDALADLSLAALTKQVLDDAQADNLTVNRALDNWFGDIPDPTLADLYGDEDGEL